MVRSVKINFCGDSFCREGATIGKHPDLAWTTLLARKLNATIVGLGKSGAAYEHAFQTFDASVDYTVFCWTEPHRIYHEKYPINIQRAELEREFSKLYKAAFDYYKYLHDFTHTEEQYKRELFWFDHAILSEYQGKAVHLPCFKLMYQWKNGITVKHPLNERRDAPFSMEKGNEIANHLTEQQNAELADEIYSCLKL